MILQFRYSLTNFHKLCKISYIVELFSTPFLSAVARCMFLITIIKLFIDMLAYILWEYFLAPIFLVKIKLFLIQSIYFNPDHHLLLFGLYFISIKANDWVFINHNWFWFSEWPKRNKILIMFMNPDYCLRMFIFLTQVMRDYLIYLINLCTKLVFNDSNWSTSINIYIYNTAKKS